MDTNYRSIADTSGINITDEAICPPNPLDYNDVLKFSNAHNCSCVGATICGGKEDVVDLNRFCESISIRDCTFNINGQQAVTCKGGCKSIEFSNILIRGNPSTGVDFDLGNYSEQSDLPPKDIWLKFVVREDGKPVQVRCLNCCECEVHVVGGNVHVFTPWWVKLGLFDLYCWLRKKNIIKS